MREVLGRGRNITSGLVCSPRDDQAAHRWSREEQVPVRSRPGSPHMTLTTNLLPVCNQSPEFHLLFSW